MNPDTRYTIAFRQQIEVNNDPQRRCYNGCHFSTEKVWTPWRELSYPKTLKEAEDRVQRWKEWDEYIHKVDGFSTVKEYKIF